MLAGKGINRAGEGITRAGYGSLIKDLRCNFFLIPPPSFN